MSEFAEQCGIPRSRLERANHMDQLNTPDGRSLYVLESYTGEKHLVHADVVEYDGGIDHPMVGGVVGFVSVLCAVLAPLALGIWIATAVSGTYATSAGLFGGVVVAWALSNVVLHRTRLGDALYRFMEWNDHKNLIIASRGGESA